MFVQNSRFNSNPISHHIYIIFIANLPFGMKDQSGSGGPEKGGFLSTSEQDSSKKSSENSEIQMPPWLADYLTSSTYLNAHSHQDIVLRRVYILNKQLFQGTAITQNMRARLRGFIMAESCKQWVMRDTCALACTYIDLYFLHKGYCAVQDFQTLAIACLILALKLQEGKFPTISFNIFCKDELLAWERKVAKRLEYQLSPPTYYTFGEDIVFKWDRFTSREDPEVKSLIQSGKGFNSNLRSFYQQLDCLFMVLESLSWQLEMVIMNMFYLHARRLNVPQLFQANQLSDQEFTKIHYSNNDKFKHFFQKFLQEYSREKKLNLNPTLGNYLRLFLAMSPSNKEWPFKNNTEPYQKIRIWDKLQTCPKDSYLLAKSVMEKLNSGSKKK